jgi:hypothetical protein
MTEDLYQLSSDVREVFLIPPEFTLIAEPLTALSPTLSAPYKSVALAFQANLHSVLLTLSIPFQYTFAHVQSLHHQRYVMAERIRALKFKTESDTEEDEARRERDARQSANGKFKEFADSEGRQLMPREVLERLATIKADPESNAAARELTRQGAVLVWGAFEVLARDLFVEVLNRQPERVETLLSNPSNRKRFGIDKLEFGTLSGFGFDLSKSLGTLLAQRADLDDVVTIKDAYGALFPSAELAQTLSDWRLWVLFQRRNVIVHRRGIVDQQYNEKTGETLPLGSQLWPTPTEVESYLEAAVVAGARLLAEVSNAG